MAMTNCEVNSSPRQSSREMPPLKDAICKPKEPDVEKIKTLKIKKHTQETNQKVNPSETKLNIETETTSLSLG